MYFFEEEEVQQQSTPQLLAQQQVMNEMKNFFFFFPLIFFTFDWLKYVSISIIILVYAYIKQKLPSTNYHFMPIKLELFFRLQ